VRRFFWCVAVDAACGRGMRVCGARSCATVARLKTVFVRRATPVARKRAPWLYTRTTRVHMPARGSWQFHLLRRFKPASFKNL
jgi:hypothetical protein